jgi:hypothetical protein
VGHQIGIVQSWRRKTKVRTEYKTLNLTRSSQIVVRGPNFQQAKGVIWMSKFAKNGRTNGQTKKVIF